MRHEIESSLRQGIHELCTKRDHIRVWLDNQEKAIQELERETPSEEIEDALTACRQGVELLIPQLEGAISHIKILEGLLEVEQFYMDRNW
jgi:hypothetical protein